MKGGPILVAWGGALSSDDRIVFRLTKLTQNFGNEAQVTAAMPGVAIEFQAGQVPPRHQILRNLSQSVVGQIETPQLRSCIEGVLGDGRQDTIQANGDALQIHTTHKGLGLDGTEFATSRHVQDLKSGQRLEGSSFNDFDGIATHGNIVNIGNVVERCGGDFGEVVVTQAKSSQGHQPSEGIPVHGSQSA